MVSLGEPASHRTFLYAPGSNERMLGKALEAGADAVICDLEDAVASVDKESARERVGALVRERAAQTECSVHVRINLSGADYSADDVEAVVQPGLEALRLPKCESARAIAVLDEQLGRLEQTRGLPEGSIGLYPTIESAAGALALAEIARASSRVVALAFGPADFAADVGILAADTFEGTLLVRSLMVLESRAARIGAPVDGAYTSVHDLEGLRALAVKVRDLGFAGKSAIHPVQIPVLHGVFTPSPEEIDRARRIVTSLDENTATNVVDGSFVDPAVVARANAVLRRGRQSNEEPADD